MASTGVGVTLVVAGTIFRFAVTSKVALDAHIASVILTLAGIFALTLPLLVWGPLKRRRMEGRGPAQRPR